MAYPSLLQQSYDQVILNPYPYPNPNPNPDPDPDPNPNPNPDVLRTDDVPGHAAAALRPAAFADVVPRL